MGRQGEGGGGRRRVAGMLQSVSYSTKSNSDCLVIAFRVVPEVVPGTVECSFALMWIEPTTMGLSAGTCHLYQGSGPEIQRRRPGACLSWFFFFSLRRAVALYFCRHCESSFVVKLSGKIIDTSRTHEPTSQCLIVSIKMIGFGYLGMLIHF